MNQQPCDQYTEWMSLAQDGLLDGSQNRLLHRHLADCPMCQAQWEAMTLVSRMLRSEPMLSPSPGFVARFEDRLARRGERRQQFLVGLLLGIGVITLALLALPSVWNTLYLAAQVVLPHQTFVAVEAFVGWVAFMGRTLLDTGWLLVRHLAIRPEGWACLGSAALMGLLAAVWMRFLWARTGTLRA